MKHHSSKLTIKGEVIMKKLAVISVLLVFCMSQFLFADESTTVEEIDWEAFSKNVIKNLATNNDGVRISALQNIIENGDKLNVDDAVFDIMSMYRNSKNQKVRQLAVVALHKIHNEWAMGFLKRNLKFETNPTIKRQILDCMLQHEQDEQAKTDTEKNQLGAIK
jgi:hypothetical protein